METEAFNLFDTQNISNIFEGLKIADYTKDGALEEENEMDNGNAILNKLDNLIISEKLFCSFCNVGFCDKVQQRHHYKLDWHRYNLKQNLLGRSFVSEDQFQQCVDDVSSISGSESDSEQAEDENCDMLRNASKLNKRAQSSAKNKNFNTDTKEVQLDMEGSINDSVISRNSKLFFENNKGQIISIYRCVIQGKKNTSSNFSELASLATESTKNSIWGIIMLGGGHFAGAVFEGNEILLHKTFHSYTVRAKQGGSQSMRDNKSGGGSHPKSAGASLRRYNEASLAQHVQDIVSEWNKKLAECSVLFFRAVSHNRNILFGGRSPLFNKNDPRIRSIPFATRRATFKEVKRVHEQLSSVTVYSSVEVFKNSLTEPTLKKIIGIDAGSCHSSRKCSPSKNVQENLQLKEQCNRSPQKSGVDRAKSRRSPHRPLPDIVNELGRSSPESDHSNNYAIDFVLNETEISLSNSLVEFEDTVPEAIKKRKTGKSKDKRIKKKKDIPPEEKCEPIVLNFYKKLKTACNVGDIALLKLNLEEVVHEECNDSMNQRTLLDENQTSCRPVTVNDLNKCLNDLNDINGNTLLHIASEQGHCEIVRLLLSHGSDPCKKNKKYQTPYVISKDKETRNTFRRFLADFPDKFDYSESQIPSPLSDEIEKEMSEKRRAQRKAKREREKVRKLEEDKRRAEESERERFLRLSDREKRAFAAEMRILAQVERNGGTKPIISRCFQCAKDITGLVPFEYDIGRFCSMDCLKIHRVASKKS